MWVLNQFQGQPDVQSGSSIDEAGEDFYALLGLPPFESNTSAISARARDLMRDARRYQVGPRASEAQTRIERLATASACLLDPAQKVAYDNVLRERFGLPPVSIRSQYVPADATASGGNGQVPRRQLLSPKIALALIVLLAVSAILIAQHLQHSRSSAGSSIPAGDGNIGSTHAASPAGMASGLPIAVPGPALAGPKEPPPAPLAVEKVTPPGLNVRFSPDAPKADLASTEPGDTEDEEPELPVGSSPPANPGTPRGQNVVPPPRHQTPPGTPVATPGPLPTGFWPYPDPQGSPQPETELSSAEVLRQLKDIRLNRTPARRLAANPQMLGAHRVLELVRYGRANFPDDRRFQKQLDQEVIAFRRLYPPFREVLPEPEH